MPPRAPPPEQPNEEELRAAYEAELGRITSTDMIAQAAISMLNLGARRLAPAAEGHRGRGGSATSSRRATRSTGPGADRDPRAPHPAGARPAARRPLTAADGLREGGPASPRAPARRQPGAAAGSGHARPAALWRRAGRRRGRRLRRGQERRARAGAGRRAAPAGARGVQWPTLGPGQTSSQTQACWARPLAGRRAGRHDRLRARLPGGCAQPMRSGEVNVARTSSRG